MHVLRLHQEVELGSLLLGLGAHGKRTVNAEIFVLVSLRQYQKQFFPHRNGGFTPGAVKRGRFKLIKTRCPHENIINDVNQRDKIPACLALSVPPPFEPGQLYCICFT
jgi:hypothetical protein